MLYLSISTINWISLRDVVEIHNHAHRAKPAKYVIRLFLYVCTFMYYMYIYLYSGLPNAHGMVIQLCVHVNVYFSRKILALHIGN